MESDLLVKDLIHNLDKETVSTILEGPSEIRSNRYSSRNKENNFD